MQEPPRRPKGHRPQLFDDPAIDQLHAAFVALATELAVAFDRIDTLERLLEERAGVTRAEIDGYQPDEKAQAARGARRADIADRLLRPFRDFRDDQLARAEHGRRASGD
jgi:Holliday junction resolvasome RuvABC ATP-dependent DNA helicase subunit